MNFYDRLKADNKRILASEDMCVLTLTNLSGTSYTGRGRITNPGMSFNPQGQPVASQKYSIAFNIESFEPVLTIADIANGGKGMRAEFINAVGESITGIANLLLVNKTFGHVEATLSRID